jgi:hypothetical protein
LTKCWNYVIASAFPRFTTTCITRINHADETKSDADWVALCRETWREKDGAQKTHYSQQHPQKTRGAHTETIAIDAFLDYYHSLSGLLPDMMLEVKDKNRSAIKCILCTSPANQHLLETEWGRYKYSVLERSPADYQALRTLLKDKGCDHAVAFYQTVERALSLPEDRGRAVNALEHVWGYCSDLATPAETKPNKHCGTYLRAPSLWRRSSACFIVSVKNTVRIICWFLLLYALIVDQTQNKKEATHMESRSVSNGSSGSCCSRSGDAHRQPLSSILRSMA